MAPARNAKFCNWNLDWNGTRLAARSELQNDRRIKNWNSGGAAKGGKMRKTWIGAIAAFALAGTTAIAQEFPERE
ncbi:MAG: hypothetical protein AB8B51_07710, partial [Sedimentitalea sp.]